MGFDDGTPSAKTGDIGVAVRGVLMGLAEVVPGVSGGTMAFITGIYRDLVGSLAAFGPGSLAMVFDPMRFATHHNLRFLFALGLGMLAGILLFAQLMHYLLVHFQPLVWAFFSGVIVASVVAIGRSRAPGALLAWGPAGVLAGISLLWIPQIGGDPNALQIFLGGAVAVCAWLLPAISGSYVLLTLGVYHTVIEAIATLDFSVLLVLAAGCATGLLMFARVLAWLLRQHGERLLSFLTGFMLGSLFKLWPWQANDAPDAPARLLSPAQYAVVMDSQAYILWACVLFLIGVAALWMLTKLADHE
jgi:putative membrane protein